ncbi:hypothetical protein HU200_004163 [Digitaria exilis]|uniref:Uncharacterized protein n=1 Tax=Digitaria exilis TaxID=1010633 RepID=A0A835KXL4_9POAL|nr:hypothetical protein HU200_004163 [Digitaria exilis]
MVDLVPIGSSELLMAYGAIGLEIFYYTTAARDSVREADEGGLRPLGPSIIAQFKLDDDDETEGYTSTITEGPDRQLEITYLVIPTAIQTSVEVRLKLKADLGSTSRAVYGNIKATAIDYMNIWVHLFSCDRGRCLSFPSGTTSILPLSLSKIALPCSRLLRFHIEVDLTVATTTCESHEEDDKNLKFILEFTRGITSQERQVDGDRVQVQVEYESEYGLLVVAASEDDK